MLGLLPGDCGGHVTVILGLAVNEKLPLLESWNRRVIIKDKIYENLFWMFTLLEDMQA